MRDTAGDLRQFVAGNSLVNITLIDPAVPTKGYQLDVYHRDFNATKDAGGLYPVGGSLAANIQFANDDPAGLAFDAFTITETIGSKIEAFGFAYDAANDSWTMTSADGRRVERLVKTTDATDPNLRTEMRTVEDSAGGVLSRTLSAYRTFSFGEEMVSHTVDPTILDENDNVVHQGRDLTTTWEYYTSADSIYKTGLLKQVVTPTGSWSRYEYDETRERTKAVYSYFY